MNKFQKGTSEKPVKIPVNQKWVKSITEICKDPLKKPVNNKGMNNVCLKNIILHIFFYINKHMHLSKNDKTTLWSVHFGVVVVEPINCKCGGMVRNEIW